MGQYKSKGSKTRQAVSKKKKEKCFLNILQREVALSKVAHILNLSHKIVNSLLKGISTAKFKIWIILNQLKIKETKKFCIER